MPETTLVGRSIDPMLVPLPVAFFVAVLGCDLIYWAGGDANWIQATRWLLGAGVLMGFAAAVIGLMDTDGEIRRVEVSVGWWHRRGSVVALVIEAFNWYLRADTPAEIVLPTGLLFSIGAVSLLLLTTLWANIPAIRSRPPALR